MSRSAKRRKFVDYLLERGLVTETTLGFLPPKSLELLDEKFAEILPEYGILAEEDAYRELATFLGVPFVDLLNTNIDPSVAGLIPSEFAREHAVFPFLRVGNEVSVAFAEIDPTVMDDVERFVNGQMLFHLAPRSQILKAVELQQFTSDIEGSFAAVGTVGAVGDGENTAIIELANAILLEGLKMRASDIHIEPQEHFTRVRCRIDGLLREVHRLPVQIQRPLISRLKVMAKMDIAETRRPQDSRLRVTLGSFLYKFRVSTAPSLHGEKVVLRILVETGPPPTIDRMYFSQSIEDGVRDLITLPNGIILVTGPTGSGKTTTCYALLKTLAVMERNVVTIENPIEYEIPIATQIQVEHGIGLTFANVLRSVLRQDPDIILLGEIRDVETARTAAEAALTGHLVLSTLHTNNAIQAMVRLVELGVEPFMVSPTLAGVVAQRLVRRICQQCRVEYSAPAQILRGLNFDVTREEVTLYRGRGCNQCAGTGFRGRIPVHELVRVDARMRDLIIHEAPVSEIERAARATGYRSMRVDGLKKALAGLTTPEEVIRVTPC
jgi:type IV pilus assembly protein PilB